jgi:amino acid transporter
MSCCENVSVFQSIARVGIVSLRDRRQAIMIAMLILMVLSALLLIVAMAGSSGDEKVIKQTCWTYEYVKGQSGVQAYLGLKNVAASGTVSSWASCAGSSTDCKDCQTAGKNALNSSAVAFIVTLALLICTALRIRVFDMVVYKNTALLTAGVVMFCLIIGMGNWDAECMNNLPTTGGISYKIGPGLGAAVATFFFVLVTFILHLIIPVEV